MYGRRGSCNRLQDGRWACEVCYCITRRKSDLRRALVSGIAEGSKEVSRHTRESTMAAREGRKRTGDGVLATRHSVDWIACGCSECTGTGRARRSRYGSRSNGGRGGVGKLNAVARRKLAKNKLAWPKLLRAPNDGTGRRRRKGKQGRLGQERRCGGEEEVMNEEIEEEGCDLTRWGGESRRRSVRNAH